MEGTSSMNHTSGSHKNSTMSTTKHMMHMTFFWGSQAQVLFSNWPGTNPWMYALSLIVIFVTAVLFEWISNSNFIKQKVSNRGVLQTLLHGLRVGISYLLMLALMSFNVGIFIAAVGGHVMGFFIFGCGFFQRYDLADGNSGDVTQM